MDKLPQTLHWSGETNGELHLLDQTKLPGAVEMLTCRTVEEVWQAIKQLSVRGAPAIGIAAAYGVILGAIDENQNNPNASQASLVQKSLEAAAYLETSRPTAVNLFWALDRMRHVIESTNETTSGDAFIQRLLQEARTIHEEDRAMCIAIGNHGAEFMLSHFKLPVGAGILTHCNAGALATGGEGTALAVLFELARRRPDLHFYADETRPLLQGARLTMWELMQRELNATLLCDSMAGYVMQQGLIQAVVTGADRIAANGDSANKIGTYSVAVLANAHAIPFFIAAPTSTFDASLSDGSQIQIEMRASEEVTGFQGLQTAPAGAQVLNPAFDVTPARLITALFCERGSICPVDADQIRSKLLLP